MWQEITTQADADSVFNAFSGFHDSLLREAHLINNGYLSDEGGIVFGPDHRPAFRLLFQGLGELKEPLALEMVFVDVQIVRISHADFDVIDSASLKKSGSGVFWAPEQNWSPEEACPAASWIHSLRAFCRFGQLVGQRWHYWNLDRPSFFDDLLISGTG